MKRYEQFNKMFNKNESAEVQSLGMILADIREKAQDEEYNFDLYDDLDVSIYERKFEAQVKWLNEEVKQEG